MKIGYCKSYQGKEGIISNSTALVKAGCEVVIIGDTGEFNVAVELATQGDCVVVTKYSDIAISEQEFFKIISVLGDKGAYLYSLDETAPVSTARKRRYKQGRRAILSGRKLAQAKALLLDDKKSISEIVKELDVSRGALYRVFGRTDMYKKKKYQFVPSRTKVASQVISPVENKKTWDSSILRFFGIKR